MPIQMDSRRTTTVAQGELELLRPVNGPVDEALFLKGAQGAVQRDAVYRAEHRFEIALGNGLPALQENAENLFANSRQVQGVFAQKLPCKAVFYRRRSRAHGNGFLQERIFEAKLLANETMLQDKCIFVDGQKTELRLAERKRPLGVLGHLPAKCPL